MAVKIGNLEIDNLYIGSLKVDKLYLSEVLLYPSEEHDYSKDYLTFKITSAGNIKVPTGTTYSINGGEWENTGTTLTVNGGESIRIKGNNNSYNSNSFYGSTAGFEVEGNIMSLIYGDDFKDKTSFQVASTFRFLFNNCTGLTTAENLILPATTLESSCYSGMFEGCSSLNYIKCLATDISASNCTNSWVDGVASTGTFVKAAGVEWPTGVSGIPSGWTIEEE